MRTILQAWIGFSAATRKIVVSFTPILDRPWPSSSITGIARCLPMYRSSPGAAALCTKMPKFLRPQVRCSLAFGDGKPPENLLRHESVDETGHVGPCSNFVWPPTRVMRRSTAPKPTEANSFVYDMGLELMKRKSMFDTSRFSPRDVERYGTHICLGRHMLLARQMLEEGVMFVKVTSFGWDSHGDNFNAHHQGLVSKFDQPFASIVEDLAASRPARTYVGDCHLRIRPNTARERELGPRPLARSMVGAVMGGCGLKPGVVVGKTSDDGTYVTSLTIDHGHIFHTWYRA